MQNGKGYFCAALGGALGVLILARMLSHPDGCACPMCQAKRKHDKNKCAVDRHGHYAHDKCHGRYHQHGGCCCHHCCVCCNY